MVILFFASIKTLKALDAYLINPGLQGDGKLEGLNQKYNEDKSFISSFYLVGTAISYRFSFLFFFFHLRLCIRIIEKSTPKAA